MAGEVEPAAAAAPGAAAAPPGARPAGGARREKSAFAALVAAGALLGFLGASRPWVHAQVSGLVAGGDLTATGRQAAGIVPSVALVALAGGVAVLTTRRVGRTVAGTLLMVAGAAAAATSVGVLRTPASAVASVIVTATGRAGETDAAVTLTGWPWVGVASGVLVALAGVLAVARARDLGGLSSRFDAPAAGEAAAPAAVATTSPPGGLADAGAVVAAPPSAAPPQQPATPVDEWDPGQVWDALTRGEDPTR